LKTESCHRIIDEYGETVVTKRTKPQKQLSSEEITKLIIKYENGKTVYEHAEQFGYHRITVSNLLKRQGVTVTNKLQADVEQVIKLYESRKTAEQIASIMQISASTVLDRLRKSDVKVRARWDYGNNTK
jgi:DNA-binding CsgD family transcriptional regulator